MVRVSGGGSVLVETSGTNRKRAVQSRPRRPSISGGCCCPEGRADARQSRQSALRLCFASGLCACVNIAAPRFCCAHLASGRDGSSSLRRSEKGRERSRLSRQSPLRKLHRGAHIPDSCRS